MNSDILKGKWNQLMGSAKERWGELTDDELTEAEGNYEVLVGKLQEKGRLEMNFQPAMENVINHVMVSILKLF